MTLISQTIFQKLSECIHLGNGTIAWKSLMKKEELSNFILPVILFLSPLTKCLYSCPRCTSVFSCLALFAHWWHGQGIFNMRCLSSRKTRGTFIICGTHFPYKLYLKAEKMGFFSKTWRCSVWVSHQQKHTRARFDTVHSQLSSINRRTYASSTRSLGMCKLTLYSLTF